MRRIFQYIAASLAFYSLVLRGAEVPKRFYSPETVLIQSQVNDIVQDSRGFIWVGTMGGINIFTGAGIYTLSYADGLESEWIRRLVEATPDTMWIGTNSGLGYYAYNAPDSAHFLPKTKTAEIRGIAKYQNRLYIATMYQGLFTLAGDTLQPVVNAKLPGGTLILDITVWQDTLWLATSNGLQKWDGEHLVATTPEKFILHLAPSPVGLWCSSSEGLFLRRATGVDWIIRDQVVTDVAVLGDTVAASLYYEGVVRFDLYHPHKQELITPENGLPKSFFRTVFLDRQASLWIGTDGGGLVQIVPYGFQIFTTISGLANEMVNQVNWLGDTLLVGTDGGVFYSTDGKHFQNLAGSATERVWCVKPFPDQRLLVGYDNGTVLYSLGRDGKLRDGRQLWNFAAIDMLVQGDSVWVATEKGLRLYHSDGHWQVFPPEDGFSSMFGQALAGNGPGVYIATDRGLNYYNNHQVKVWEPNRVIWDVAVDEQGKIWLGTDAGLIVLNPEGKRLAWYNQEDGLPGSTVYSVAVADSGMLWLGTNQGIVRFEDGKISTLGYEDGLPANEMNNHAILADDSGVWVGSIGGLIHFPSHIRLPAHYTPVVPYQFWQNERSVGKWDTSFPHLHPVLTVALGAPDFLNPAVEFRYRLMNRPGAWIGLGTNTQLSLSSLSPGRYDIGIQAHGVRHQNWGLVYHLPVFVIRPPFYQRWEFLTGVLILSILFFSGLTYTGVHYKHERETMRRQAGEIALAREFNQQLVTTGLPNTSKAWQISVASQPYNEFSGDFYFAFRGRGKRFCVIVGDVAGSGLETSYLNGFLKMSLQSQDWATATMSGWLVKMNQALHRLPRSGLYVALTTAVITEETGETFCLSAGNPPPFKVGLSGRPEKVETPVLPPLGVFGVWKPQWRKIHMEPESLLALHSDGLRLNLAQEEIEPLQIADLLGQNAHQAWRTLLGKQWLIDASDDRLLVTINRLRKSVN